MRTARKREASHRLPQPLPEKVVVDFPAPLFRETETRRRRNWHQPQQLIRCAVEQYLEALQRKRLEQELAAGYVANSALDRRIAQEFSAVDYETF